MARISRYPVVSDLRSEASTYVTEYRNGRAVRRGRGLAFWFHPLDAPIAEVPLGDHHAASAVKGGAQGASRTLNSYAAASLQVRRAA
jgi:hypothetical protein